MIRITDFKGLRFSSKINRDENVIEYFAFENSMVLRVSADIDTDKVVNISFEGKKYTVTEESVAEINEKFEDARNERADEFEEETDDTEDDFSVYEQIEEAYDEVREGNLYVVENEEYATKAINEAISLIANGMDLSFEEMVELSMAIHDKLEMITMKRFLMQRIQEDEE